MAGAVAVLPVPGRDGTVVLVVITGAVLVNGRPNPTTSTAPTPTLPVLPGAGRNVTVEAVWPITMALLSAATATTAGSTNVNWPLVDVRVTGALTAGVVELSVAGNESTAGVVSLIVVDRICGNCGSSCRTTPRTVTIESEFGDGTNVIVELSAETTTSLGLVAPSTISHCQPAHR